MLGDKFPENGLASSVISGVSLFHQFWENKHIHHAFNEEGDIVREDHSFNPAQLPK